MPTLPDPPIYFLGIAAFLAIAELTANLRGYYANWLASVGAIGICAALAVAGLDALS